MSAAVALHEADRTDHRSVQTAKVDKSPAEFGLLDHVRLLHSRADGHVPLARIDGEDWLEKAHPRDQAETAALEMAGLPDVYVGLQTMSGWRSVTNVRRLSVLYADLDYRNVPTLAAVPPHAVAQLVQERMRQAGWPPPTLVVATGRGLAVYLTHEALPARALKRWHLVEDALVDLLQEFGSDPAARDAARVFRLIGTVNSKVGLVVRALHVGEAISFETLAARCLPHTRAQIRVFREEAARRKAEREAAGATEAASTKPDRKGPARRLDGTTWAETLLADLHRLRIHRWGNCLVPVGSRDLWLFAATIALAWVTPAAALPDAVSGMARLVGWPERRARRAMGTALRKAEAAARGDRGQFEGRECDLRYTVRGSTVARWLSIGADEARQAGLRLLAPAEVRVEREKSRWHERREAAGRPSRDEWREEAAGRADEAARLHVQGKTWREIAGALGLPSWDAARQLARRASGATPPDRCLRVSSGPRQDVRRREKGGACDPTSTDPAKDARESAERPSAPTALPFLAEKVAKVLGSSPGRSARVNAAHILPGESSVPAVAPEPSATASVTVPTGSAGWLDNRERPELSLKELADGRIRMPVGRESRGMASRAEREEWHRDAAQAGLEAYLVVVQDRLAGMRRQRGRELDALPMPSGPWLAEHGGYEDTAAAFATSERRDVVAMAWASRLRAEKAAMARTIEAWGGPAVVQPRPRRFRTHLDAVDIIARMARPATIAA